MKSRAGLVAIVAVLGTAGIAGQQPPAPAQPTFRSGVELVELDAIVTDASGNVVADLTADDFEVSEGGKPQTIATFSQVNIPIERAERPLYSPTAIEPDVATNVGPEGRLYVFALDDVRPANALRARVFLRRFIEQHLGTNDLAAVVLLAPGRRADAQDFTSNRRLLLRAIDRFSGWPEDMPGAGATAAAAEEAALPLPGGPNLQAELTATSRMEALKDLMEFMARLRGRRKTVLLLSEGLGVNMLNVIDAAGATTSRAGDVAREAMRAALRGNVAIYPIDPKGLVVDGVDGATDTAPEFATIREGATSARDSLRAIADVTGGFAVTNSNNFAPAFERIVRENSAYYILGYYSTNENRDGKYRRLSIRVKRPGLQVRARDGYLAPTGRAPAPPPAIARSVSPALTEAIGSPLPASGVPMRLFAAPYKGDADNAAVAVSLEIDASGIALEEKDGTYTGQLEVAYVATSAAGKVFPGDRHYVTLSLKPDTYARVQRNGFRVLLEPRLPPGRYQLRVAAGNAGGRAGSVVYDLEVPDFSKGALTMSGVSLTSVEQATAQTARPKDPLRGLLPGPITAVRDFASTDTLALYTEIYESGRNVATHGVVLKLELRADDGRVVTTRSEERSSSELEGKPGGYGFGAELPLEGVTPGIYVIHVEAQANIGNRPTVSRDVQIRVR
jgi:VWFA-related protein